MGGFLKIIIIGTIDIDELLRVPVEHGEPGTLYLYHNPMSLAKRMGHVLHIEGDLCNFSWYHGLWPLEAISELRPHDFTSHHELKTAHLHISRVFTHIGS